MIATACEPLGHVGQVFVYMRKPSRDTSSRPSSPERRYNQACASARRKHNRTSRHSKPHSSKARRDEYTYSHAGMRDDKRPMDVLFRMMPSNFVWNLQASNTIMCNEVVRVDRKS